MCLQSILRLSSLWLLFSRNEFFQLLAQRFVGAEQQRLCCRLAQFHHGGNLSIVHLLVLVHHHRQALPFGQRADFGANRRQPLPPQKLLLGSERLIGEVGSRAGLLIRFVEPYGVFRALVTSVARVIYSKVG